VVGRGGAGAVPRRQRQGWSKEMAATRARGAGLALACRAQRAAAAAGRPTVVKKIYIPGTGWLVVPWLPPHVRGCGRELRGRLAGAAVGPGPGRTRVTVTPRTATATGVGWCRAPVRPCRARAAPRRADHDGWFCWFVPVRGAARATRASRGRRAASHTGGTTEA
jgi:hypothetical protein